ncbi:MAG: motility protein A, partial [Chloroflexota bacterium]
IMSYFNISAGLIVFGGSLGAGMIAFPMGVVKKLPKMIMMSLREPVQDPAAIVQQFVKLAERARKEGLLALEQEAPTILDPLIRKGIMLVVDGTDPEVVTQVMEIEIAAREARHETGISMLEALGGFAPTLGILGTVMGLIRILAHMNSAAEMASSIAVAFTATLYGVGSANLFWLPLATKLKRRSALEAETASLIVDGVAAIQAGDNPRIVQEKLAGYILPAKGKKAAKDAAAPAGAPSPAKAGA